ncbi:MAG: type II 3-dehydroquinate dehydratase, partial [Phycisphaerales bacterium]
MTATRILLVHGPNLSQLGVRDPRHYGTGTLAELVARARAAAEELGAERDHLLDARVRREALQQRCRIIRGRDQIDIPDQGFGAQAKPLM